MVLRSVNEMKSNVAFSLHSGNKGTTQVLCRIQWSGGGVDSGEKTGISGDYGWS